MGHIYTYDEIKAEFINRDYILLTENKLKSNQKYEYICKKHLDKGSQFIDWGHFYCSNQGCRYCGREKANLSEQNDFSTYDGKTLAESKGFEYIGMTRHDKKIWVQFICPKHRQYGVQEMPYSNMKRVVVGCQHCIGRNDDEKEVLQEMYDINPNMILLEPYGGREKRVNMLCTKHNIEGLRTPREVILGRGCVKCGLEKLSQQMKIPEAEYINRLNLLWSNIQLINNYDSVTGNAYFHCLECNCYFIDNAGYVLRRGCPNCGGTSMEEQVGIVLSKYNIKYKPQFSYADCKDKRKLPFDFYLCDYNVLVEYDGKQHEQPVNFGGISDEQALKNFLITQKHDNIKNTYCKNNNIPLIRIPCSENKNIEKYLINELKIIGVNITTQND